MVVVVVMIALTPRCDIALPWLVTSFRGRTALALGQPCLAVVVPRWHWPVVSPCRRRRGTTPSREVVVALDMSPSKSYTLALASRVASLSPSPCHRHGRR